MESSLFVEGGRRGLGGVVVCAHDAWAGDDDFSAFVVGIVVAVAKDVDADAIQGSSDTSDAHEFRGVDGEHGGVFGHAVALVDDDAESLKKRGDFS